MLRGIAELRGVTLASNAPEMRSQSQFAPPSADEASTAAAVRGASSDAQAAWNAFGAAGGKMKASAFARQFGDIRPAGPGGWQREALWRSPENAAEVLWYLGLIFRTFADFGDGPDGRSLHPRRPAPTPSCPDQRRLGKGQRRSPLSHRRRGLATRSTAWR